MDLVASCKDKLSYFRIKELKDVLTQLGLSKQGKKQDLYERILAILSDEQDVVEKCYTIAIVKPSEREYISKICMFSS